MPDAVLSTGYSLGEHKKKEKKKSKFSVFCSHGVCASVDKMECKQVNHKK